MGQLAGIQPHFPPFVISCQIMSFCGAVFHQLAFYDSLYLTLCLLLYYITVNKETLCHPSCLHCLYYDNLRNRRCFLYGGKSELIFSLTMGSRITGLSRDGAEPYNPRTFNHGAKGRAAGHSATKCCVIVNGPCGQPCLLALLHFSLTLWRVAVRYNKHQL